MFPRIHVLIFFVCDFSFRPKISKLDWRKVNNKLFKKYGSCPEDIFEEILLNAGRRNDLTAFYEVRDPSKVAHVSRYIEDLDWRVLNAKLRKKYGESPDKQSPGKACFFKCIGYKGGDGSRTTAICADGCKVDPSDLEIESLEEFTELANNFPLFVKFYSPFCGHCKAMKADWQAASKEINHVGSSSAFMAVAVNCQEPSLQPVCNDKRMGITGYPKVLFVEATPTKESAQATLTYPGPRVAAKLVSATEGFPHQGMLDDFVQKLQNEADANQVAALKEMEGREGDFEAMAVAHNKNNKQPFKFLTWSNVDRLIAAADTKPLFVYCFVPEAQNGMSQLENKFVKTIVQSVAAHPEPFVTVAYLNCESMGRLCFTHKMFSFNRVSAVADLPQGLFFGPNHKAGKLIDLRWKPHNPTSQDPNRLLDRIREMSGVPNSNSNSKEEL